MDRIAMWAAVPETRRSGTRLERVRLVRRILRRTSQTGEEPDNEQSSRRETSAYDGDAELNRRPYDDGCILPCLVLRPSELHQRSKAEAAHDRYAANDVRSICSLGNI